MARILLNLSAIATILTSFVAVDRRSMASSLRRCQLSWRLLPSNSISDSASTSSAMRLPNSRSTSLSVTSVSSTVSCRAAAARSSWSFVMVAAMETASIGWTIYGKPFPLRSAPWCALTAKTIALSRIEVSMTLNVYKNFSIFTHATNNRAAERINLCRN